MSWTEMPCPKCKKMVAASASRCPHCQTDYSPEEIAERKSAVKSGAVGCAGFAVVACLALAFCTSSDDVGKSSGDPKKDVVAVWQSVLAKSSLCDSRATLAAEKLSQAGKPGASVVEIYGHAKRAQEECSGAAMNLSAIKVPGSLPEKARKKLEDVLLRCSRAAGAKSDGMEKAMEAINGDARPSVLAEMQERGSESQSASLLCAAGFFEVGSIVGLEPSAFAEPDKKAR